MEVLEDFILAQLLDGHVQVVKSWKVLSSLLELEGFILALSMEVLVGVTLALLLKSYVQVVELAGVIFALSMEVLVGINLALLLEATSEERRRLARRSKA